MAVECAYQGGGVDGGTCMAGGHVWRWGGDMHAGETTTEAGGTHPTGMNSCYLL